VGCPAGFFENALGQCLKPEVKKLDEKTKK